MNDVQREIKYRRKYARERWLTKIGTRVTPILWWVSWGISFWEVFWLASFKKNGTNEVSIVYATATLFLFLGISYYLLCEIIAKIYCSERVEKWRCKREQNRRKYIEWKLNKGLR